MQFTSKTDRLEAKYSKVAADDTSVMFYVKDNHIFMHLSVYIEERLVRSIQETINGLFEVTIDHMLYRYTSKPNTENTSMHRKFTKSIDLGHKWLGMFISGNTIKNHIINIKTDIDKAMATTGMISIPLDIPDKWKGHITDMLPYPSPVYNINYVLNNIQECGTVMFDASIIPNPSIEVVNIGMTSHIDVQVVSDITHEEFKRKFYKVTSILWKDHNEILKFE